MCQALLLALASSAVPIRRVLGTFLWSEIVATLMPSCAHRNFELPWLDERSRCRLEMQKKQTPHRTCRK